MYYILITLPETPGDSMVVINHINISAVEHVNNHIKWDKDYIIYDMIFCPWWLKMIKNLPEMQGTWVMSLGGEDPLDEGIAAHSSILAWRIPWTEETGGVQSLQSQKSQTQFSD